LADTSEAYSDASTARQASASALSIAARPAALIISLVFILLLLPLWGQKVFPFDGCNLQHTRYVVKRFMKDFLIFFYTQKGVILLVFLRIMCELYTKKPPGFAPMV
jgi:hypothetical protein